MEVTILFLGKHKIVAEHITCVKDAGNGKTNVWVVGQSAADGAFLVDMPEDEVMKLWSGEDDGTQEDEEMASGNEEEGGGN